MIEKQLLETPPAHLSILHVPEASSTRPDMLHWKIWYQIAALITELAQELVETGQSIE